MEDIDYKCILGKRIKNFRNSFDMTQEDLCNVINLEISNLSNIENGKSYPSMLTLIKIIQKFNIEPNKIFDFITFDKQKENLDDSLLLEQIRELKPEVKKQIFELIKVIQK